ncbi:hypothetical protein K502DRAFT_323916 [Neoconidiobolus thromboides FSU 785]|nr:hypothetical protein K502DRAFT_323916 [Neoconidiobolus thromboides FSU 785]
MSFNKNKPTTRGGETRLSIKEKEYRSNIEERKVNAAEENRSVRLISERRDPRLSTGRKEIRSILGRREVKTTILTNKVVKPIKGNQRKSDVLKEGRLDAERSGSLSDKDSEKHSSQGEKSDIEMKLESFGDDSKQEEIEQSLKQFTEVIRKPSKSDDEKPPFRPWVNIRKRPTIRIMPELAKSQNNHVKVEKDEHLLKDGGYKEETKLSDNDQDKYEEQEIRESYSADDEEKGDRVYERKMNLTLRDNNRPRKMSEEEVKVALDQRPNFNANSFKQRAINRMSEDFRSPLVRGRLRREAILAKYRNEELGYAEGEVAGHANDVRDDVSNIFVDERGNRSARAKIEIADWTKDSAKTKPILKMVDEQKDPVEEEELKENDEDNENHERVEIRPKIDRVEMMLNSKREELRRVHHLKAVSKDFLSSFELFDESIRGLNEGYNTSRKVFSNWEYFLRFANLSEKSKSNNKAAFDLVAMPLDPSNQKRKFSKK